MMKPEFYNHVKSTSTSQVSDNWDAISMGVTYHVHLLYSLLHKAYEDKMLIRRLGIPRTMGLS